MLKTGYPTCGALGGSRECNSLSQRSALLTCEVKMGYPTKWGFSAGSSRWGLSQRLALLVCEVRNKKLEIKSEAIGGAFPHFRGARLISLDNNYTK